MSLDHEANVVISPRRMGVIRDHVTLQATKKRIEDALVELRNQSEALTAITGSGEDGDLLVLAALVEGAAQGFQKHLKRNNI
jgi:hypothetical protein